MNKKEKASVPKTVDGMIAKGIYTRQQIMDEVSRVRPDFKDPSAAVSNGLHRFRTKGLEGSIKEGDRKRKPRAPRAPRASAESTPQEVESREERFETKRKRFREDIHQGFKNRDEYLSRPVQKLSRVWPV